MNNLRDELEKRFPIKYEDILIDKASPEDLLEVSNKTKDIDPARLTCRPLKKRDDEELLRLYDILIKNKNNFLLGVYIFSEEEKKYKIIGRISFYDYNPRNRSAEFGYILRTCYMRKGYMKKALKKVCKVLLLDAKINKIYAQTGSFNEASIALLNSVGFKKDAVLRQHHEYKGKLYDDFIFSLIRDDLARNLLL